VVEIGYARVSSLDEGQVLDRQLDALKAAGCERVFEDRESGGRADRPGLNACLDYLRRDVLVVLDLDRLGRRAGELIRLIHELRVAPSASARSTPPWNTTTPGGRAFVQIQAAFAEMERQPDPPACQRGHRGGPRPWPQGRATALMTPERLRYVQHLMADQARSIPAICRELGDMPASTLPLPACRRVAEGTGTQAARLSGGRRSRRPVNGIAKRPTAG
jgi:hypothetical protein